ncbi:MAG: tRNA (adenosine(37)-N6)-threonylcarbamoyltransferase complex dimerization subunit type 1 TsaB [Solirubrobacteraceae bacterium]
MRILGLDTATRANAGAPCDFGVPCARDGGDASQSDGFELEARDDPPSGDRPRHATRLLACIIELLARAGSEWDEVDRIAVGLGPGSFTGLRIGVATARALGRARAIDLVGVSTLQSLALAAQRHPLSAGTDVVLAVLDARRGEVFAAGWRAGGADGAGAITPTRPPDHTAAGTRAQRLLAPRALTPETLAERLSELGQRVLMVGDGAVAFRSILAGAGAKIPPDSSELHKVTAICHCHLARTVRASATDEILPEYLRLPDAEIARRSASRK